ncbi:MAG: CDP-diacylglycerol--glycerol-3-phosphate 3-phosphatidyltransferase [Actinobacteria bacterium]|nr:CDP-diacylglycerol--glycerol-3-phosphate 3-phosphatidyltransferase [Actinomycetota bacterium]
MVDAELARPPRAPHQHRGRGVLREARCRPRRGRRPRDGLRCVRLRAVFPLNLPNALTLLRILAVPVVVVALLVEMPNGDVIAAAVFAAAALTDGLDGYIARSRNSITTFGKLMDPLADKLLVIGALLCLVSLGRLEAWVAMVIIAREVAVTILRTIAAERGLVIAASWLGKAKTATQIAAIIALIATNPSPAWVDVLVYAAVAVTIISGADYFFGLRRRIEQDQRERAARPPRSAA